MSKPIVRICPNTAENITHVVEKLTDNGAALRYACSLEHQFHCQLVSPVRGSND